MTMKALTVYIFAAAILSVMSKEMLMKPATKKKYEYQSKFPSKYHGRYPSKYKLPYNGDELFYMNPEELIPKINEEETWDTDIYAPTLHNWDLLKQSAERRIRRNIVFPGGQRPVRPNSNKGVIFPNNNRRPFFPSFPSRRPIIPTKLPTTLAPFPTRTTAAATIDPGLLDGLPEGTTKGFREPVTPGGPKEREHVTSAGTVRVSAGIDIRAGATD